MQGSPGFHSHSKMGISCRANGVRFEFPPTCYWRETIGSSKGQRLGKRPLGREATRTGAQRRFSALIMEITDEYHFLFLWTLLDA